MRYKHYINKSAKEVSYIGIGGGICDYFEVFDEEGLLYVIELAKKEKREYYIIGNASKLLFPDNRIDVIIIKMCLRKYEISEDKLFVEAGVSLIKIARLLCKNNIAGFAGLADIPASIGGAIVNNAGAFGDEISKYLESVIVIEDGERRRINKEDMIFAYRYSSFKIRSCVIVSAIFYLKKSNEDEEEKRKEFDLIRKKNQPYNERSLGSTFLNYPNLSVGQLIEELGLKGVRCGNAKISEKHGNFIVNLGDSTSKNVLDLIDIMTLKLYNKTRIVPRLEMIILRW